MTVEFYQDKQGEWRWRVVAGNGRIMADGSEGYHSKYNVKRAWGRFLSLLQKHRETFPDG
jgi:uncharacterized protein YegP (UPF0339 family)